jgi:hypothetical protein
MATEYDELKLSVTLDDQATAKLEPLKKSLNEFTDTRKLEGVQKGFAETGRQLTVFKQQGAEFGEATKAISGHIVKMEEAAKKMTGGLGQAVGGVNNLVKGFTGAAGAAGGMALAIGGGIAATLAAAVVLERYTKLLGEFATKQQHLSTLQKVTGVSTAETKSMTEALARAGVPTPEAESTIAGLAASKYEIRKEGPSELRQKLLEGAGFAGRPAMMELFRQVQNLRPDDDRGYAELMRQATQNVIQHRGPIAGMKFAADIGDTSGALVRMKEPFPQVSEYDKRRGQELSKLADDYGRQLTGIEQSWNRIKDAVAAVGLPTAVNLLTQLADKTSLVAADIERIMVQTFGSEDEKKALAKKQGLVEYGYKPQGYVEGATLPVSGAGSFGGGMGLEMKRGEGFFGSPGAPVVVPATPPQDTWQRVLDFIRHPLGGQTAPHATQGAIIPSIVSALTRHPAIEEQNTAMADQNKQMGELTDELKKLNDQLKNPDAMAKALGLGDIGAGAARPTAAAMAGPRLALPDLPALPPTRRPPTGASATPPGTIGDAGDVNKILATAGEAGVDPAHWKAIASIESDLDPGSNRLKGTQYKGLFQIGARGAGSEWARTGSGDIYDPMDNARSAAKLAHENAEGFRKAFGRDPSVTEIYMMHQQGLGFYTRGAMTNIGGNMPPGLRGRDPGSVGHGEFEQAWSAEIERRAERYRTGDLATPRTPPPTAPRPSWMDLVDPMTGRMPLDRSALYGAMGGELSHKVEGTGKPGTTVAAESGGLFKELEMNRQMQMEHAASSARRPTVFGPQ